MSKKSNNPNRQGFYNHLENIKTTEQDKDEFLKASRLERHERHREPLRRSDIFNLVLIIALTLICCTILVLGYLGGSFGTALLGCAGLGLIVFFIALIRWA